MPIKTIIMRRFLLIVPIYLILSVFHSSAYSQCANFIPPNNEDLCLSSNIKFIVSNCSVGSTYAWTIIVPGTSSAVPQFQSTMDTFANGAEVTINTGAVAGTFTLECSVNSGTAISKIYTIAHAESMVTTVSAYNVCVNEQMNFDPFIQNPNPLFVYYTSVDGVERATGNNNNITDTYTSAGNVGYDITFIEGSNGGNQCYNSSIQSTVTVDPLPSPPTAAQTQYNACKGSANPNMSVTVGTGQTASWYSAATGGSPLTNGAGTLNYTSTETNAGTYSYFVETIDGDCISSSRTQINLTIFEIPTLTNNQSVDICSGDQVNFNLTSLLSNGITSTYQWTATSNMNVVGESTTTQTGNTINDVLTLSGTTSAQTVVYTVVAISTNGSCPSAPVVFSVNVSPTPTLVSNGSEEICSGETLDIDLATLVTNGVNANFSWVALSNPNVDGEDTSQNNNNSTIDDQLTLAGGVTTVQTVTYSITATASSNSSCQDVETYDVLVYPPPNVTVPGSAASECGDINHTVSGVSVQNGTIAWTVTDGNGSIISGGSTVSPTYNPALSDQGQTVVLTIIVTGTGGCDGVLATDTYEIEYDIGPIAIIGDSPTTICVSDEFTFSNVQAANGNISWMTNGNGTFTNTNTATPTYEPNQSDPSTVSFTLEVQGTGSCSGVTASDTYQLGIVPLPTAEAGGNLEVCEGDNVQITGASASNNSSVSWTENGPGSFNNPNIINPSYQSTPTEAPNTVTATLTAFGAGACSGETATDNMQITVNQNPEFSGLSDNCSPDLSTYSIQGSTEFTDNISVTPPGPNVNLQGNGNFTISGIPEGTAVTITFSNPDCSIDEVYGPVDCDCQGEFVPSDPVNTTANNETCFGDPNPQLSVSVDAGDQANWYNQPSGGSIVSGGGNTTTYTSNESNPGMYCYYVEAVDPDNGCVSDNRTQVCFTIHELPNAQASNTGGSEGYCFDETIQLNATGGNSYEWSGPANFESMQQNPTIPNADSGNGGTYTVTVTDNNDCSSTATTEVLVNPPPTAMASNDGPYCQFSTITLTASGGNSYEWSGPGNFSETGAVVEILNAEIGDAGDYTVTVSIGECESTATTTVEVFELPNVDLDPEKEKICQDEEITITATNGYANYEWEGPNGSINDPNNIIDIADPGQYTVTVTENNGGFFCTNVATVDVPLSAISAEIVFNNPGQDSNGICLGDDVTIIATETTVDDPVTRVWEGFPGNEDMEILQDTPDETTTYTVTITNVFDCPAEASLEVIVHEPIEGDLSTTTFEYCDGDPVTVNLNNSSQYQDVDWSIDGEDEDNNSILFIANENITELSADLIDINDCESTSNIGEFVTYDNPIVQADSDVFVEQGTEVTVSVTDVIVDPDCQGAVMYEFYLDMVADGVFDMDNSELLQTGVQDEVVVLADGPQNVTWELWIIATDMCSCNSEEVLVAVNITQNFLCDIEIDKFSAVGCLDNLYEFEAESETEDAALDDLLWQISNITTNDTFDITDPGSGSFYEVTEVDVNLIGDDPEGTGRMQVRFTEPGKYRVIFKVKYGDCERSKSKQITIYENATFEFGEFPDELCFDSPLDVPFTGFPDDFDYTLYYSIEGEVDSFFFFPGVKSFKYPNLTEDITFNFDSVANNINSNLSCVDNSFNESVTIDVLDSLVIDISSMCNDELDSIFYIIEIAGGDLPYNFSYIDPSGNPTSLMLNDGFFSTDLGELGNYVFNVNSQCDEDTDPIAIDDDCVTCPPIEDAIPDAILPADITVCDNAITTVTINDVPIDTSIYTIVPVLQFDQSLTIFDPDEPYYLFNFGSFTGPSITFDIDYNEIAGIVDIGETYSIVFYALPKTPTGFVELNCIGNEIEVFFESAPEPEALAESEIVCQNEINVLLFTVGDGQISWDSESGFPGNSYTSGKRFVVDFSNTSAGESYDFYVSEEKNTCAETDTITLSVSSNPEDVAPPIQDILLWPSGLFVYDEYDLCYRWGNNSEYVLEEFGSSRTFIYTEAYPGQFYSPSKDTIWVEVSYPDSDGCNDCVNRVYFDQDQYPKLEFKPGEEFEVKTYPNPVFDEFQIFIFGKQAGEFELSLIDISGRQIKNDILYKEYQSVGTKWDFNVIPPGLYILRIEDQSGVRSIRKIIKN